MTRSFTDTFCAALPGSQWASHTQGSHDCWKVGDKVYAQIGMRNDGVSVKTPSIEDANLLVEMERAIRAPYFHKSWVRIPWASVPEDELRDRLLTSYTLVRGSLTKKLQAKLGPVPD